MEVNANGKACGVKMARTETGRRMRRPPPRGDRPRPEHVVPADAVVMASACPHSMEWLALYSVELTPRPWLSPRKAAKTPSRPATENLSLWSDIVRGSDLVVTAIAEGREAAD